MKIFQPKLFYSNNRSATFKTIILLVILLFCLFNLSAQKESNIKLKIETGILWASDEESFGLLDLENFAFFAQVEPTLKISNNTFIGLRIGASVNTQKIVKQDPIEFYLYPNINTGFIQFMDVDNRIISIIPTINYYLNKNNFRPYLGIGVGYYFITNYTGVSPRGIANPSENLLEINAKNQVGLLLRGGLDFGKLIVGLEFNYIPEADIKIPNGQLIGTVDNNYIGLSIGYSIKIRKNSK